MELRRLGDPFLRPRASPLLSFLPPSVPQSWWSIAAPHSARAFLANSARDITSSFHTTACRSTESPSTATGIEKPQQNPSRPKPSNTTYLDFLKSPQRESPTAPPRFSFSESIDANQTVSRLLDQTLDNLPNPTKRELSTSSVPTSASRMQKAWSKFQERERAVRSPGQLSQNMKYPPPAVSSSNPEAKILSDIKLKPVVRAKRTIRSRPTIGRTIEVNQEKQDVGGALKRLEILCAVNRVRQDQYRQRFHERPGMKRKRLKSERWRKLFKESFRMTVARVQEMRRKGW